MAPGRAIPAQMAAETEVSFGPFRLEGNARLWRGEHLVPLRPGALALLRYLAERPGQLVTKDELLQQVWPGIYVTTTSLRVGVHAIRRALQEDPGAPRFLETVGRQGYRFLGVVGTSAPVTPPPLPCTPYFVGRAQELAALHTALARAQQGARQVMFLCGEPGIGKTTLVDRFLAQVQVRGPVRVGRGQCIELHGLGEAYLPLLEVLGQLCQQAGGEHVLALLRRYAPLWLVQMAGLLEAHERDALHHQVQGRGQKRMVREFAEVVERLAADAGVVLVFEDLQWSDASTVAALAYLAQRRGNVRLHLLGTYRPAEVAVRAHPLRGVVQELASHGQCAELALELLTAGEVEAYLGQRFGPRPVDPRVSQMIHHATDGNALFMVSVVDYLCQQGWLVDVGGRVAFQGELATLQGLVPPTLQQLITRHIALLGPEECHLLEIASVAGQAFAAAEVAGVVGRAIEDIEGVYDTLARQEHFIASVGRVEWPDGTVTMQYAFRHAVYQQVLYERIGAARCVRLHRQLGERKEAGYGERAAEIAGALAVHFTQGRDARRAARYHGQAGEHAFQRSAYREARDHCQAGLALLAQVPDTPERQRQELALRMTLMAVCTATRGFGGEELVQHLAHARTLCQVLNDDATLVSVLVGLGRLADLRADRAVIAQQTDEKLQLLERVQEPTLALQLHTHLGTSYLLRGQHGHAQAHYAQALDLYDPQQHQELVRRFGMDPAVVAGVFSGASLWLAGWPDRARVRLCHGLHRARALRHPYSLCMALSCASRIQLWCGALAEAEQLAAEEVCLARAHDIAVLSVQGSMQQACIRVQRGEPEAGLVPLLDGLAQYRGLGAPEALPSHLCFVADAYLQLGRIEEGLATIAEAVHLTETLANVWWAAEVYRLKGALLLAATPPQRTSRRSCSAGRDTSGSARSPSSVSHTPEEAEAWVHKALEMARQQGTKALELRATMTLSRLWQQQDKRAEARELLAPVYGWFTEGFDTADLQDARALLDELVG